MPADQDAQVVREAYAAFNRGDVASLCDLVAADMVRHDLTDVMAESQGADAVTDFLEKLRRAMPDLEMAIEDIFASQDGMVAARSTLTGTHRAEFMGIPATGQKVAFAAITLYRVESGQVAEAWSLVDWAGALKQMSSK